MLGIVDDADGGWIPRMARWHGRHDATDDHPDRR
jgi:hypothetical protein